MEFFHLKQSSLSYPSSLQKYLGRDAPSILTSLGNLDILNQKNAAIFCSVKCPGHLILKTHGLAQQLKEANITVVGGFHSPIERECLRILLRDAQPIIVCPARSLGGMRIRAEYKKPIEEGRLLLLSPFKETQRRNTVETALERNRLVAALSDIIFIAHASQGSKTETFCRELLGWGKFVYTFDSDANANLIKLGAIPIDPKSLNEFDKSFR